MNSGYNKACIDYILTHESRDFDDVLSEPEDHGLSSKGISKAYWERLIRCYLDARRLPSNLNTVVDGSSLSDRLFYEIAIHTEGHIYCSALRANIKCLKLILGLCPSDPKSSTFTERNLYPTKLGHNWNKKTN